MDPLTQTQNPFLFQLLRHIPRCFAAGTKRRGLSAGLEAAREILHPRETARTLRFGASTSPRRARCLEQKAAPFPERRWNPWKPLKCFSFLIFFIFFYQKQIVFLIVLLSLSSFPSLRAERRRSEAPTAAVLPSRCLLPRRPT